MVLSEEISKRLCIEQVVCFEAELDGGRCEYRMEKVVESTSLREAFLQFDSKGLRTGMVEGLGAGREESI